MNGSIEPINLCGRTAYSFTISEMPNGEIKTLPAYQFDISFNAMARFEEWRSSDNKLLRFEESRMPLR